MLNPLIDDPHADYRGIHSIVLLLFHHNLLSRGCMSAPDEEDCPYDDDVLAAIDGLVEQHQKAKVGLSQIPPSNSPTGLRQRPGGYQAPQQQGYTTQGGGGAPSAWPSTGHKAWGWGKPNAPRSLGQQLSIKKAPALQLQTQSVAPSQAYSCAGGSHAGGPASAGGGSNASCPASAGGPANAGGPASTATLVSTQNTYTVQQTGQRRWPSAGNPAPVPAPAPMSTGPPVSGVDTRGGLNQGRGPFPGQAPAYGRDGTAFNFNAPMASQRIQPPAMPSQQLPPQQQAVQRPYNSMPSQQPPAQLSHRPYGAPGQHGALAQRTQHQPMYGAPTHPKQDNHPKQDMHPDLQKDVARLQQQLMFAQQELEESKRRNVDRDRRLGEAERAAAVLQKEAERKEEALVQLQVELQAAKRTPLPSRTPRALTTTPGQVDRDSGTPAAAAARIYQQRMDGQEDNQGNEAIGMDAEPGHAADGDTELGRRAEEMENPTHHLERMPPIQHMSEPPPPAAATSNHLQPLPTTSNHLELQQPPLSKRARSGATAATHASGASAQTPSQLDPAQWPQASVLLTPVLGGLVHSWRATPSLWQKLWGSCSSELLFLLPPSTTGPTGSAAQAQGELKNSYGHDMGGQSHRRGGISAPHAPGAASATMGSRASRGPGASLGPDHSHHLNEFVLCRSFNMFRFLLSFAPGAQEHHLDQITHSIRMYQWSLATGGTYYLDSCLEAANWLPAHRALDPFAQLYFEIRNRPAEA
eukprot:gene12950-5989_t